MQKDRTGAANITSAAGVMLAVQVLQALAGDMRVDLRSRQIAVAQQQLDDAQIGAAIQQVGRKGVPQAVRRQFTVNTCFFSIALDDVPERLAGHAITTASREQVVGLPLEQNFHARRVDEIGEPALGFLAQRDQAFTIALADDAQDTLVEVDL